MPCSTHRRPDPSSRDRSTSGAVSGKPVQGSRFLWEINNWQYPQVERGDVQKDNPDDASADGADMMAMIRYLVMWWWQHKQPEQKQKRDEDRHPGFDYLNKRVRDRASDMFEGFRIPQYKMPVWGDD